MAGIVENRSRDNNCKTGLFFITYTKGDESVAIVQELGHDKLGAVK